MDDEQAAATSSTEPEQPAPDMPAVEPQIARRPSRLLALAFVALLSSLILLGTTEIGAAASTLLGGPSVVCGGP